MMTRLALQLSALTGSVFACVALLYFLRLRCGLVTKRCLAAQLALGKPIFGGRTRAQQLEYVFKCCGSPGQGRWPEGNKAPLYRHLRPVDKDGKSLHFKPRLAKVTTSETYLKLPWFSA